MRNMVQRFFQHLIKGKDECQLCEQVKDSAKNKTVMGRIMTIYDLGRERKRDGNLLAQEDQLY